MPRLWKQHSKIENVGQKNLYLRIVPATISAFPLEILANFGVSFHVKRCTMTTKSAKLCANIRANLRETFINFI